MGLLESGEMYLETILILKNKNASVRSIDICNELNYSKPSVSRAMHLLEDKGYITFDKDGFIDFTDVGEAVANKIYERHELLTTILKRVGVSADTAEEDACKIEHDISDETFNALKSFFQNN